MKTEEELNQHIDRLVEISDAIEPGKVTILTGGNGMGKSLIRKLMNVSSVSMEKRTSSNPEFGALSGAMQDLGWIATSMNTLHLIDSLFKSIKGKMMVIDEPEIGMGEEMQLGLCEHLNNLIANAEDFKGLLIITHSRIIVRGVKHDAFINIEGMSEGEWLNRDVIALDPIVAQENSEALRVAVQNRINKNKTK